MESSGYRRTPLILPKLKAKAELLKALPSLRKYFPDAGPPSPERRGGPGRRGAPPPAEDSDDEEAAAARAQEELRRVKKERTALLQALAAARAAGPVTGDNVQCKDIAALRASLAEKQQALNELRESNADLEQGVEALALEHRDALLRAPEPGGGAAGVAAERLAATLAAHEAAAKEVDTRASQYQLLADRTARDRDAAEHAMQAVRDLLAAAGDDAHALSQLFYEVHASKEATERDLGAAVAAFDDSRHEWQRRLRARRREVRAMERRLAEEAAEAEAAATAASEAADVLEAEREAAAERERAAAAEVNAPAVLAALAAAEAAWAALQAVAGGSDAPESVGAAWRDLKERAEALQGLLEVTREREDRVRAEAAALQAAAAAACQLGVQSTETPTECVRDVEMVQKGEKEATPEEKRAHERRQALRRLGGLAAAAELSLSALYSRLKEAQESAPEFWEGLRAQRAAQAAPPRRSSVAAARRASVALPRRVSAVDLAASRGGQGPRRGSIAVPVDRRVSVAVGRATADDDGADAGTQAPGGGVFPELPALVAEIARQVESLLALEPPRAVSSPVPPPAATEPPGFKRSTMAGPAWVEIRVDAMHQEQCPLRKLGAEEGAEATSPRPSAAAGLPPHAVEAAERYMRRLVGVTVEPSPRRQDAFVLEESDEEGDDRPVQDRAALKHRSHKITHPKVPKSPQRRGGGDGSAAAASPTAAKSRA